MPVPFLYWHFFQGAYTDLIAGILDDLSTHNDSCSGAAQQLVNGLYRCVELSAIIGMELG